MVSLTFDLRKFVLIFPDWLIQRRWSVLIVLCMIFFSKTL